MQTNKMSWIETITSTVIGFLISLVLVTIIFPMYGANVQISQSIVITSIFTVASVIRGYGIRRVFNYLHHKTYI